MPFQLTSVCKEIYHLSTWIEKVYLAWDKERAKRSEKVMKRDVMTRNWVMLIPCMQLCVQSAENSDMIANIITRV